MKASSWTSSCDYFLDRLVEVHEDRQLVLNDAGGIGNCIFRGYRTIGFNGQGQLVIIKNLAFAGRIDLVGNLANR